jgi:hypothetical protein
LSQAEIEAILKAKKAPSTAKLKRFWNNVKSGDKRYGGQLNKEAVQRYKELLKNAVEKGTPKGEQRFNHEADFVVGIDILTGKATKKYSVVSVPNGAHIVPGVMK